LAELEIPDFTELGVDGALTGAGALALYWTFGPSVKAIGNAFGTWTEYRVSNLLRIGEKVDKRIAGVLVEDGQTIHPRAAKELIDEASWIDDDTHQEYMAGLLVASRSPEGISDNGVYYTRIVANLSSAQIKLHHALYGAYENSLGGNVENATHFNGDGEGRRRIAVHAARDSFHEVCGDYDSFAVGANGLLREGLIDDYGSSGDESYVFVPSLLGAILYHRALGFPAGIGAIRVETAQLMSLYPGYVPVAMAPDRPRLRNVRIGY